MTTKTLRFESLIEHGGTWMVLDRTLCAPASLGGSVLRGQTKERSFAACGILKRIYACGLDAMAIRRGVIACHATSAA